MTDYITKKTSNQKMEVKIEQNMQKDGQIEKIQNLEQNQERKAESEQKNHEVSIPIKF